MFAKGEFRCIICFEEVGRSKIMSKRKPDYQCPNAKHGCTEKFKEDGMNDVNFQRHLEKCKHSKKKGKNGITNYFSRSSDVTMVKQNAGRTIAEPVADKLEIVGESSSSQSDVATSSKDGNERPEKVLCKGFQIIMNSGSVLSRYPFHRHDPVSQGVSTLVHFNITLTHGMNDTTLVAHALTCDGSLSTSSVDEVNRECADIEYSPTMKKLIEVGDSDTPHEKMQLDMLSFDQLKEKFRDMRKKAEIDKLDTLNLLRKNKTLTKQATLNERFRELITRSDIPRLGMLLQLCSKNGMGLHSIIGRIGDAINMKYRLRKYGENEWDFFIYCIKLMACLQQIQQGGTPTK